MAKLSDDKLLGMFNLIDSKLTAIHEQTTKTNGRVTDLELWRSNVEGESRSHGNFEKFQWLLITTLVGVVAYFIR